MPPCHRNLHVRPAATIPSLRRCCNAARLGSLPCYKSSPEALRARREPSLEAARRRPCDSASACCRVTVVLRRCIEAHRAAVLQGGLGESGRRRCIEAAAMANGGAALSRRMLRRRCCHADGGAALQQKRRRAAAMAGDGAALQHAMLRRRCCHGDDGAALQQVRPRRRCCHGPRRRCCHGRWSCVAADAAAKSGGGAGREGTGGAARGCSPAAVALL